MKQIADEQRYIAVVAVSVSLACGVGSVKQIADKQRSIAVVAVSVSLACVGVCTQCSGGHLTLDPLE